MITRRDVLVALSPMVITAGAFAAADEAPRLGSSAFDWNAVQAKVTDTGSVRSFFKAQTTTLKNWRYTRQRCSPGLSPHPPHRHPNEEMVVLRRDH